MKNLTNIKDYITSLTNSELYEVKDYIDREIYLSELTIESGEEVRK